MATRTRNSKGQFVKGHKKIGGRKSAKRSTKRARKGKYREGAASFIKWSGPAGTKRHSMFGGKRARTKAGRRGHAASRKGHAGKLKVGQSKTIHAKKTHKTYKITRVK